MAFKRKRVVLSLADKIKIIDKSDEGFTGKQLAEMYGVGQSTISDIRKSKPALLNFVSVLENESSSRKSMKAATNNDLEDLVFKWFLQQRSLGNPISGPILCEKAKMMAHELGYLHFKASNGWLRNFKSRHDVRELDLSGEKLPAKSQAAVDLIEKLSCEPEFLCNADEIGLDWKTQPEHSSASKREYSAPGYKVMTMSTVPAEEEPKAKKPQKTFNWETVSKRHILLKFFYFGWGYGGYASQSDERLETIEKHLFAALQKCCLIKDRESSNYNRCGRTDAGVSALSQVISIDVRSNLECPDLSNVSNELKYCKMLNRLLPDEIRCYAWCHVASTISSRFDCTSRTYNYLFPRGNLNIEAMKTATKLLEGSHDFRNLCKMNVANGVVEFRRQIHFADIVPVPYSEQQSAYQIMKFVIISRGFLWHQIRCIMAVLFTVGEGYEPPDIISQLLDVQMNPCKPQYQIANPLPLSLVSVEYEGLDLNWYTDEDELQYLTSHLRNMWSEFAVKSCMAKEALNMISGISSKEVEWKGHSQAAKAPKTYIPLLSRHTCLSLEGRIQNVESRKQRKKHSQQGVEKKRKIQETTEN